DATDKPGQRFAALFPAVAAAANRAGLDPAADLLPVRPAAHYHMGGILVDRQGRSTVPGLYAAGEVASTGLHGANRLASNSLLEAVVCARWVARYLKGRPDLDTGLPLADRRCSDVPPSAPESRVEQIREIVTTSAGVLRDAARLRKALGSLRNHLNDDAGLVGYLMVRSALHREESRGGQYRTDFPDLSPEARHQLVSRADLEHHENPADTHPRAARPLSLAGGSRPGR
ncbi:MAG: FAD-binding protein, partial [Propioniciclava sp.]